jgi:thioesterase domain-containing protein
VWLDSSYARFTHRMRPYEGDVVLVRVSHRDDSPRDQRWDLGWTPFVRGRLTVIDLAGDHTSFIEPPLVEGTAHAVAAALHDALGDDKEN